MEAVAECLDVGIPRLMLRLGMLKNRPEMRLANVGILTDDHPNLTLREVRKMKHRLHRNSI